MNTRICLMLIALALLIGATIIGACGGSDDAEEDDAMADDDDDSADDDDVVADDDDSADDDDDDDTIGDDDDDIGGQYDQINNCVTVAENENADCLQVCGQTYDSMSQACVWKACTFDCHSAKYQFWNECLTDNDCEEFYTGPERDPVGFWDCRIGCNTQYKPCYAAIPGYECSSCDTPYQECVEKCRDDYYF